MYNKEFQIVNTEEKAYFLGQAFGDGCNQYIKKKKFALASIDTDTDLYVKLHQIFPFLKLRLLIATLDPITDFIRSSN